MSKPKISKGRFFYNMSSADTYEKKLKKAGRQVVRWTAGHGDVIAYVVK